MLPACLTSGVSVMSLIQFTAGAWLLFFLMSAFAVMTWRERLARHAFMLGLVALISLVGVLAERYFWH
jgi:hypothetical protein